MFHNQTHFFLIVFPHLSLCYLSPSTSFPFLSLSLSLSAEWLAEMDVMRQVHAGREMEAVPWRSAAVNKVKNNQVTVDCSSRGPTAATGTAAMQQYITFALEMTFFIYMHLQSTLVSCVQLTLFFVYLLSCPSWFSTDSPCYLFTLGQFHYSYKSFLTFQSVTFVSVNLRFVVVACHGFLFRLFWSCWKRNLN